MPDFPVPDRNRGESGRIDESGIRNPEYEIPEGYRLQ